MSGGGAVGGSVRSDKVWSHELPACISISQTVLTAKVKPRKDMKTRVRTDVLLKTRKHSKGHVHKQVRHISPTLQVYGQLVLPDVCNVDAMTHPAPAIQHFLQLGWLIPPIERRICRPHHSVERHLPEVSRGFLDYVIVLVWRLTSSIFCDIASNILLFFQVAYHEDRVWVDFFEEIRGFLSFRRCERG